MNSIATNPSVQKNRVLKATSEFEVIDFTIIESRSGVRRDRGLLPILKELVAQGEIIACPISYSGCSIPAFRRANLFDRGAK